MEYNDNEIKIIMDSFKPNNNNLIFGDFSEVVLVDNEKTPEQFKRLIKLAKNNIKKQNKELKNIFKNYPEMKLVDIKNIININVFDIDCYKDLLIEFFYFKQDFYEGCENYHLTEDKEKFKKEKYKFNLLEAKIERYEELYRNRKLD